VSEAIWPDISPVVSVMDYKGPQWCIMALGVASPNSNPRQILSLSGVFLFLDIIINRFM